MTTPEAPEPSCIVIGGGRLAYAIAKGVEGAFWISVSREPGWFSGETKRSYNYQVGLSHFESPNSGAAAILRAWDGRPPIVYAHGPAGDAATKADIPRAIYAHVTLPTLLGHQWPARRMIYLSTLVSPAGSLYGRIKQAGEVASAPWCVLRFGQVLDPERGVAGVFLKAARAGRPCQVPQGRAADYVGNDDRIIAIVPPSQVAVIVRERLKEDGRWPHVSEWGEPITVRTLAKEIEEAVADVNGRKPIPPEERALAPAADYRIPGTVHAFLGAWVKQWARENL